MMELMKKEVENRKALLSDLNLKLQFDIRFVPPLIIADTENVNENIYPR